MSAVCTPSIHRIFHADALAMLPGLIPSHMHGRASGAIPVSHTIAPVGSGTELFRGGYLRGTPMGLAHINVL